MKVIASGKKHMTSWIWYLERLIQYMFLEDISIFYDPKWVDPEAVAIRDQGEFVVESIVDSLINDTPKTQWQFIVRWTGYDESYDEWLD